MLLELSRNPNILKAAKLGSTGRLRWCFSLFISTYTSTCSACERNWPGCRPSSLMANQSMRRSSRGCSTAWCGFDRLKENRPFDSYLENGVSIVLAWWVVPLTLAGFWLRYVPKHDWWGTGFHVASIAVAIYAALGFHAMARSTLRGRPPKVFRWKRPWQAFSFHRGAIALGIATAFALVSLGAVEADPRAAFVAERLAQQAFTVRF